MSLRGVTATLDPRTLTEWRNAICTKFGVAYASLSTAIQTELNRMIDETHDWVSKKYGHEPWARRVWTLSGTDFTAPSTTTGLFTLPVDCRHIMKIQESETGTGAVGRMTKMEYWMAAGEDLAAHPWSNQSQPYYFFKAMSDDNPPAQTWQRVPTPSSTFTTMTIIGRGLFDLLGTSGSSQYTEMPPDRTAEAWHYLAARWYSFREEYDKAAIEMQLAEKAIVDTMINDAPDGAEVQIRPAPPAEFFDEMGYGP